MKIADEKPHKPTKKYRSINKEHLRKLVLAGFTDEQVSDFFGIERRTLTRWKQWYPTFKKRIEDWKLEADAEIEKSLHKRATGYEVVERTSEIVDGKMQVVKEVTKHVPATDTSIIFWLTNRQHGDWKRTREEVGADPLSVKVYQIIKNGNGKGGNGKTKKAKDILAGVDVQSAVQISRKGGLEIVK